MHGYETKYLELLSRQPKYYTTKQKLLRIDSLACYEMQQAVTLSTTLISRSNVIWFYALMIALLEGYLAGSSTTQEQLQKHGLLKPIVEFHLRCRQDDLRTIELDKEFVDDILSYLSLRAKLRLCLEYKLD